LANSERHEVQILGVPLWALLGILIPGYALSFLCFPILARMDVDVVGWNDRSEVEKVLLGGFLGFILYSLPLGKYAKLWPFWPKFGRTIEPLRELLARMTTASLDDAYVFHNEFVIRLKADGHPPPSRNYGYFILAVYLAVVLILYIVLRIAALLALKIPLDNVEQLRIGLLIALVFWLIDDARASIKAHFRSVCRLATIYPDILKETVSYIQEHGTKYIRAAPGIDYPPE